MKAKEIRLLDAEEINVKPKQVIEKRGRKYVMVLLYKDSRCDMARLDEAFGPRQLAEAPRDCRRQPVLHRRGVGRGQEVLGRETGCRNRV